MQKILCIGEALVDFIGMNTDCRLSEQKSFLMTPGGAPFNVSCVAGSLGGEVYFLGAVGKDEFGNFLELAMKKYGVHTEWLFRSTKATTVAYVSVTSEGERDFIFYRAADADLKLPKSKTFKQSGFKIYHFGSATAFLKGPLGKAYHDLLMHTNSENDFVSFDPNYRTSFWQKEQEQFIRNGELFMKSADLIKLSEEEANLFSKENKLTSIKDYFTSQYNGTFTITLGSKGVYLFNRDWEKIVKAPQVKVKDTTGAGDAFVGALLYELSKNNFPKKAVKSQTVMEEYVTRANQVAANICTEFGALTALAPKIS
jgi:fructokinase